MKAMVDVKGVAHSFGKENVLKDVHLEIQPGEIFGLLGPSGAGKTTLVKMIAGILEPDHGEVLIGGQPMPSLQLMKSIGYMAQSDALYHELSARENLDFFASIYGLKKRERKEQIQEVMEIVDLADHLDKVVEQYSGGMKRRLSLAASLIHEPKLLILDEPTVGIDPVLRQSIWNAFRDFQQRGMTILVTTHVMDEAEKCDRIALLRNGYVMASGTPDQLKQDTDTQSIEEAFLVYGGDNR
ncbi:MAG: heme ABC exporter ATP-binding protein CcmA [Bacillaceae bacterium]|nr:heme ABC exporter ATP-binding protein CcmA [Bacillaceae bacterium]